MSECFRPDHALCHKEFFEWQFQSKYNGGNAKIICVRENGKLQGILGYIPLQVHWGDLTKPLHAAWTLAWMTRKNSVKGIGRVMAKKVQEMYPLALTVNASRIGAPILQALRWTCYSPVPRYVIVFDVERCLKMVFSGRTKKDLDAYSINEEIYNTTPVAITIPNKDVYHPDWNLYHELRFGTVRSLEYIQWRFIEHPMFKYYFVMNGAPERPAVCVYRIDDAYGDYEAKVGRIVDFYFPNDENGQIDGTALLSTVLKQLKGDGCVYADFICSSRAYSRPFIECGAAEEPEHRQIFPMRLAPIERVARHQNVAFTTPRGYPLPSLEEMHVTKSDIDGDSPTSIPRSN